MTTNTAPVPANAHPTLTESLTRLWNRLPSLWKALLPAVAALLIVLVPANILIGARLYGMTTDNLRAQHTALLADLGNVFDQYLNNRAADLNNFAASDSIRGCAVDACADAGELFQNELQQRINEPNAYYTALGFIDNSGKETIYAYRASGSIARVAPSRFAVDPTQLAHLNAGQVYVFPISRDTRFSPSEPYQYPTIRLASPIYVDGTKAGYVTAILNLDDFFAQNFVYSENQHTFLVDSNGCLVASSDDTRRTELYKTWSDAADKPCYADLQLQEWDTAVQRYQDTVLSTRPLHGILSNSGQTWTLVVQQPEAAAYAQTNALQALMSAAHLFTVFFVAAIIVAADRATARLVRAAQMRNAAHARDIRFNPYIVGQPIDDPRMFFGRKTALAQVIGAGVMGGDDVLIIGDRGVGKTSLLHQIKRRLQEQHVPDPVYWYWPVSLSLHGVNASVFYSTLMDHILRDVEDHQTRTKLRYHAQQPHYGMEDFREDINEIIELPNTAGRQTRIVLCIDNLDVWVDGVSGYSDTFIERFFAMLRAIGNHLKLIGAGTYIPAEQFERTMTIVPLRPLKLEDARRLVTQPVADYYTFTDEAVEHILRYSDRLPLELQRLTRHTVQIMLETDAGAITAAHVERALQRAIADHESTYRVLWYGGSDKKRTTTEHLGDAARTALIDATTNNAPLPVALITGDSPVLSRDYLDDISYTDNDGNVLLTTLFTLWLNKIQRS